MRVIASLSKKNDTTRRIEALKSAAKISARLQPKVRCSVFFLCVSFSAIKLIIKETVSVRLCRASEISARLCESIPPNISTMVIKKLSNIEIIRRLSLLLIKTYVCFIGLACSSSIFRQRLGNDACISSFKTKNQKSNIKNTYQICKKFLYLWFVFLIFYI